MPLKSGFGSSGSGTYTGTNKKWTQTPSATLAALTNGTGQTTANQIKNVANPYVPPPGGQNYGFNTGGGGGNSAAYTTKAYNDAFQAAAAQPAGGPSGQNTYGPGIAGASIVPPDTNPAGQGQVTSPNAAGGVNGSTNGGDITNFRFKGSDKAWSQSDVAQFLNNPVLMQQAMLASMGMNTQTANSAFGNYASVIPDLAAFYMAQGNNSVDDGDRMAGVMRDLFQNYVTPGGRSVNPSEMLRSVLATGNPDAQTGMGYNQMQNMYTAGTPQQQMQNVSGLWNASTGFLPGAYGQAMSDQMALAQLAYQQSLLNGNNGSVGQTGIPNQTFTQFLSQSPMWQQLAGMR